MVNKDIRIPFEIDDRRYEALRFLEANEPFVCGYEMIARTDNYGTVVGEEDCDWLWERRAKLPEALWPYFLVTGRRDPHDRRFVLVFHWIGHSNRLHKCWLNTYSDELFMGALILRRLP